MTNQSAYGRWRNDSENNISKAHPLKENRENNIAQYLRNKKISATSPFSIKYTL